VENKIGVARFTSKSTSSKPNNFVIGGLGSFNDCCGSVTNARTTSSIYDAG